MGKDTKPRGHWTLETIKAELEKIARGSGLLHNTMPRPLTIPSGLLMTIRKKFGGIRFLAQSFGWELQEGTFKPHGYYTLKTVNTDLREIVAKYNLPANVIPSIRFLKQNGLTGLERGIREIGGRSALIKIGWEEYKTVRHWRTVGDIKLEFDRFVEEIGVSKKEAYSPTFLKKHNRGDIAHAIIRFGGFPKLGNQFEVQGYRSIKSVGYWKDLDRIKREIDLFNEEFSLPLKTLPTKTMLEKHGREDIRGGIQNNFGGYQLLAKKLGYALTSTKADFDYSFFLSPDPQKQVTALDLILANRYGELKGLTVEQRNRVLSKMSSRGEFTQTTTIKPDGNTLTEQDIELEQACVGQLYGQLKELQNADLLPLAIQLKSRELWERFYKRLYLKYKDKIRADKLDATEFKHTIDEAYPKLQKDPTVKLIVDNFSTEVAKAVNFTKSLPYSGWCGPTPFLFQADAARAVSEVVNRKKYPDVAPFKFLWHEPGLGKTFITLAGVLAGGAKEVLVVSPIAIADSKWVREISDFINPDLTQIYRGKCNIQEALMASEASTVKIKFYVTHYEELANQPEYAEALKNHVWDCIVIDEAHKAKNDKALRTDALTQIVKSAKSVVALTGTPVINKSQDAIAIFKVCTAHAPEYQDKLDCFSLLKVWKLTDLIYFYETMLPYSIRAERANVLFELPGHTTDQVKIELGEAATSAMLEIVGKPRVDLVELVRATVGPKIDYLIKRCAEVDEKILIFNNYVTGVADRMAEALKVAYPNQVGYIDGQVGLKDRQALVRSFRSNEPDSIRILVASIATTGEGLDLFDNCNHLIFAGLPYTYAAYAQAIARLDRNGQKRLVKVEVLLTTCNQLNSDGEPIMTVDEALWKYINDKQTLADIIVDGRANIKDAGKAVQGALEKYYGQVRGGLVELPKP